MNLHRVSSRNVLSSEVFSTLDMESTSLGKQCCFLELPYASNFIDKILSNSGNSIRSLKNKWVIETDQTIQLKQSKKATISKTDYKTESGSWMKFWDAELCDFIVPLGCAPCDHFIAKYTDLASDSNPLVYLICTWSFEEHWPKATSFSVTITCM